MKKHFIYVSIYNTDEKLCKYEIFFGEKYKNRDKLIQSGTSGQHTKNQDCPGNIGTVGMFARTSHKKHDFNPVKYLNALYHNRKQKQFDTFS